MTPHAHRALPDARNTIHIFWAMLQDIEQRVERSLTVSELQALCEKYHKRGEYKKNIAKTITQANRDKQRISIDYISRDPSKPIRTRRELEITKWDSPHLEANCLLRGEPRRFHLKQIQRAELTTMIDDSPLERVADDSTTAYDPVSVIPSSVESEG